MKTNGIVMIESISEAARPRREWVSDLWRIGVIAMLTLATRGWVLRHTEVLSRDSIAFIRYALQLEEPPDRFENPGEKMSRIDVIKRNFHPPGYPIAILAVSVPVRSMMGGTTCDSMVVSAQITSILASLLLIIPMYFLGKTLFDRQTAFVATLLFQALPICAQVGSDGLSDGLFLLMAAMAMRFATLGIQRNSRMMFLAAGFTSGLAYLVRPEGLVLPLAFGLTLLLCRIRCELRWKETFTRGTLLTVGLLAAMGPYVITIGKLTNKPTGDGLLDMLKGKEMKPSWMESARPATANFPLAAYWHETQGGNETRMKWAVKALASELIRASYYVFPLFALLGFLALRHRVRSEAALLQMIVLGVCHTLLLWVIGAKAGYVAERHTLMIVMGECYFIAASFSVLGRKLSEFQRLARIGNANFWAATLAVICIAAAVPAGLKSLHPNRAAHHAAGTWLAQHAEPNSLIVDAFAWAEFYAGNLKDFSKLTTETKSVYAIVEDPKANPHPRLHLMRTAQAMARRGELVYHWPENKPLEQAKGFIYRCDFATYAQITVEIDAENRRVKEN